jgi:hypothetical protein
MQEQKQYQFSSVTMGYFRSVVGYTLWDDFNTDHRGEGHVYIQGV